MTGVGDPFQVPIFKTTANWFDVLGVHAIRGRTFLPEEQEGADVAVITDRFGNRDLAAIRMSSAVPHPGWCFAYHCWRDSEAAGFVDGAEC